jgi:ABC-type multidrug transport system fused ATPase/permease subunit
LKNNIYFITYHNIKRRLPGYVWKRISKNFLLFFFASLLDIFGLIVIFPIINLLLTPDNFKNHRILSLLFAKLGFESLFAFVVFLLFVVVIIYVIKMFVQFKTNKYLNNSFYALGEQLTLSKYREYMADTYSEYIDNNKALMLRNTLSIPFELVASVIIPFISGVFEIIVLLIIAILIVFYNFQLLIPILVFSFPVFYLYNKIFKERLKKAAKKREEGQIKMYVYCSQSFDAFREIKLLRKHSVFETKFQSALNSFTKPSSFINLLNTFSPKFVEMIAVFSVFAICFFAYLLKTNMAALTSFLILFTLASYRIIPSINKIILYSNYLKSHGHVFEYYSNTKTSPLPKETNVSGSYNAITFSKSIDIRNLSFSYNLNQNILNKINLFIPKGRKIGIIGPTGTGKTTLINLLLRLHQETEGGIYCDGTKIDETNKTEWYKMIGYVPQNIILLDDSILANITMGEPFDQTDRKKLNEVLEASMLSKFVETLELKENTIVGDDGIKLSGGQRQRIGIARALYNGGEILIFDEATSALDLETENMITESIENLSDSLTVILVAHRLHSLKFCDKIYKIDNGSICETTIVIS